MEFNKKLQELRKEKGITQEELSKILYVSRTAVSKWESGRGYPNLDSLKRIAEYFNVTIDQLLSGEELLTVAEQDGKKNRLFFQSVIFALIDISFIILFIIPFFAERIDAKVYQETLFTLTKISTWLKIVYIVGVVSIILVGILNFAFLNKKLNLKYMNVLSLALNVGLTVIFIVSLQTYASILSFAFLFIKTMTLAKTK